MVYSACHVAVLKVVASRAFCPDVRGRTSMLMGSFHNMFTIGHGSSISVQKVGSMYVALQNKEAKLLHKCPYLWPNSRYLLFRLITRCCQPATVRKQLQQNFPTWLSITLQLEKTLFWKSRKQG